MYKYAVLQGQPLGGGDPRPVALDPVTGAVLVTSYSASVPVAGSVSVSASADAIDLGAPGVVTWLGTAPTSLRGFVVRVVSGTVTWGPAGTDATHGSTATASTSSDVFGDPTGSSLSGWYVYSDAGATLEISSVAPAA